MKHELALAHAKLFYTLYRLRVVSAKRYSKLVDIVSVRSLAFQTKENSNGESSKDK